MEQKWNTAGPAPAIDALLEGLNPAQRSAATYGIDAEEGPPLLIAAGAGTGKTKTLAHRVARLILGGADPRRLLLLTFTRRAALEMTRRAQQILVASQRGLAAGGAEAALLPWSGTFHSIGNRLLRRHAATLSLDPAFTVLDRADSADHLRASHRPLRRRFDQLAQISGSAPCVISSHSSLSEPVGLRADPRGARTDPPRGRGWWRRWRTADGRVEPHASANLGRVRHQPDAGGIHRPGLSDHLSGSMSLSLLLASGSFRPRQAGPFRGRAGLGEE